jgi:hypothetical protein
MNPAQFFIVNLIFFFLGGIVWHLIDEFGDKK